MIDVFYILAILLAIVSWFVFLTDQKRKPWSLTLLLTSFLISISTIIVSLKINYLFSAWINTGLNFILILLPSLFFYNLTKILEIRLERKLAKIILWLINISLVINLLLSIFILNSDILVSINLMRSYLIYIMLSFGFVNELLIHQLDFKKNKPAIQIIVPNMAIVIVSMVMIFYLFNQNVTDWNLILAIINSLFVIVAIFINSYIISKEYYNLKARLVRFSIICLQLLFGIFLFWIFMTIQPKNLTILLNRLYYIIAGLIIIYLNIIINKSIVKIIPILNRRSKNKKIWADIYQISNKTMTLEEAQKKLALIYKNFAKANAVKIGYQNKFNHEFCWTNDDGDNFEMTENEYQIINQVFEQESTNVIVAKKIKHKHQKAYKVLMSYKFDILINLTDYNNKKIVGYIGLDDKDSFDYQDILQITKTRQAVNVTMQNTTIYDQILEDNKKLQHKVDNSLKEIQRSNNQLTTIDDVKNDFTEVTSNQLQEPLHKLKGYLNLLLEDSGKLNKKQKNIISDALFSSNQIYHSVKAFLAVSQIKTNSFVLNSEIKTIKPVVEEQIVQAREMAKAKKIRIIDRTKAKDLQTRFNIDQERFAQALFSVIDNAIEYSPKNSSITISTHINNHDWSIQIRDHGFGISKEDQKKIFNKFFRGKKAQKQNPQGDGLGLYLAKIIVEMHNGQIKIIKSDKKGTAIRLILPINKNIN